MREAHPVHVILGAEALVFSGLLARIRECRRRIDARRWQLACFAPIGGCHTAPQAARRAQRRWAAERAGCGAHLTYAPDGAAIAEGVAADEWTRPTGKYKRSALRNDAAPRIMNCYVHAGATLGRRGEGGFHRFERS